VSGCVPFVAFGEQFRNGISFVLVPCIYSTQIFIFVGGWGRNDFGITTLTYTQKPHQSVPFISGSLTWKSQLWSCTICMWHLAMKRTH